MTDRVLAEVKKERERQDAKWGVQSHSAFKWCTILGEEFGESCQAAFDAEHYSSVEMRDKFREELIQTAAVAVAAVESLDRSRIGFYKGE